MSHTWQTFDKCLKIGTFLLVYIYKLSTYYVLDTMLSSRGNKDKESMTFVLQGSLTKLMSCSFEHGNLGRPHLEGIISAKT